ncbi:MAG: hypothetical protein K2X27_25870 [Candidatus Obscuribacterales bacterium]|nr:hypothetical protein [Candidatus Obscuribacterales bacterium]
MSVREKFSLEFVTAEGEADALKGLLDKVSGNLPDLVLFDPDAIVPAVALPLQENSESEDDAVSLADIDPVAELRMLFGSVED